MTDLFVCGSMDDRVKQKVLDWMSMKISQGDTQFTLEDCLFGIGLNPFDKQCYECVQEIFEWHKMMTNTFYDICLEMNT